MTAGYARFSGLLLVNAAGSRNEVGAFPGLHPLGRIPSGASLSLRPPPRLHPTDQELSVGARFSTPRTESCPWGPGSPPQGPRAVRGGPVLHPKDQELSVGARFSTPRTKSCPWGPGSPPHEPRAVRGGPVLHPTDQELSVGARFSTPRTKSCPWGPGLARFSSATPSTPVVLTGPNSVRDTPQRLKPAFLSKRLWHD